LISIDVASGGGAPVGTAAAGTAGPQPSGTQQPAINTTAAHPPSDSDGFTVNALGNLYRVVQEGTGRVPTVNDQYVEYDWLSWRDAFDGQDIIDDARGVVECVSDLNVSYRCQWLSEALLSMREGEVRQIRQPGFPPAYVQLRLVSIE